MLGRDSQNPKAMWEGKRERKRNKRDEKRRTKREKEMR